MVQEVMEGDQLQTRDRWAYDSSLYDVHPGQNIEGGPSSGVKGENSVKILGGDLAELEGVQEHT